jgi:Spy/CpxP family protein refolding chaperone
MQSNDSNNPIVRGRFWRRTSVKLGAVALAAVALAACGHGGPRGGGFGDGPRGMRGAAMDPQQVDARIDRMVQWVLSDVNATDDQKQKVSAIAKSAAADLRPLYGKAREARRAGVDLLAQPSVDRSALERLRAEQSQAMDAGSKRVTQALADIADVLTPEQRLRLKERMEQRRQRRWG